jgi:hypothetical protein
VLLANAGEVNLERLAKAGRQNGDAVLLPLALADCDLATREVHVLDAELARLEEAQASSVEESAHEARSAAGVTQDGLDLRPGKNERDAAGSPRSRRVGEADEFSAEDLAILCCRRSYVAHLP